MITVTSLTKVYGVGDKAVAAVQDVSLHVPSGGIFGILGIIVAGIAAIFGLMWLLANLIGGYSELYWSESGDAVCVTDWKGSFRGKEVICWPIDTAHHLLVNR